MVPALIALLGDREPFGYGREPFLHLHRIHSCRGRTLPQPSSELSQPACTTFGDYLDATIRQIPNQAVHAQTLRRCDGRRAVVHALDSAGD